MKLKILFLTVALSFLGLALNTNKAMAQGVDHCNLYGAVYVESSPNFADFLVYVYDSEAFADLIVYEEENQLFADGPGLWFFTDVSNFADFSVCFVDSPGQADFTIAYTNAANFAGCR